MRVFIDTNLWAYRLDQREPTRSGRVRTWLADLISGHEVVISTQVLIELRSVASRSLQPPLHDQQILTRPQGDWQAARGLAATPT